MVEWINLGACCLNRIDYNDVKPGDIVCTYEPLSTNQKIQKLARFQNIISLFRRPKLSRAFHFEIITKKFGKTGCYEIAHVDGSKGTVLLQNDYFPSHYSGQAFLLFRAKNPACREEIVEVAKQTARDGNHHGARRFPVTVFEMIQKAYEIFRCFIFENFPNFSSRVQFQKIAQLAVDFHSARGFLNSSKTKHLDMRCPEYVAYVLSVAKIHLLAKKILNNSSLSRQKKIIEITKMMQMSSFPFYIATPYLTSSFLVHTLLQSKQDFISKANGKI